MSPPADRVPDEELITSYLLHRLPEDETERLDELSVADDAFAVRLTAVENDLIDAYVRGELTGDALNRFQTHCLSSRVIRDKVRFAEALLAYRRPEAIRPVASQWRWLFGSAKQLGLAAAAAAILLAVSMYLIVENARLRREAAESNVSRASSQGRERELQRQLEEQRTAEAKTAGELARARESLAALEARAAANPSAVRPVIASFLLKAIMRGPGDATTVAIPRGTTAVTLRMEPEATEFARYRAVIKDPASDRIVWRSAELAATGAGDARKVSATVPVALLTPRTYMVELSGTPAAGRTAAAAGSYAFRVVLQ